MSTLSERVLVNCPLAQAAPRIVAFFRAHGNREGDTAQLMLRAAGLERSVIATMQARHLAADMAPRYRVQWAPEEPGPYPLFAGELVVEGADDYDVFWLVLEGRYEPPLGTLGKAFDAVAGRHIAASTAIDLLVRIKKEIEKLYTLDESAKPPDPAAPGP